MEKINWSNLTDFGDLPEQANTASGGSFWTGMLYMLWVIMILLLIGWGFETAIIASSFVFLVVALIMAYAGLIAWAHVLTFAGVLLFMFLYIIWSSRKS